jgi:tetratricopeptide (TPR) repeat protein
MKGFLVFVFILIVAALAFLVYTGIDGEKALKETAGIGGPAGDAEKKVTFFEPEKKKVAPVNADLALKERMAEAKKKEAEDAAARKETDKKAAAQIASARHFLAKGDVEQVKLALADVKEMKCSAELAEQARSVEAKEVPLFERILAIEPEPLEGMRIYEFKSGGRVRGWVLDEDPQKVTLKLENGQAKVYKTDVAQTIIVKREDRLAQIMSEYDARKLPVAANDPIGQYGLAQFCRERGLTERSLDHLANALDADPDAYSAVIDKEARKLFLLAVWFGSMEEEGKKSDYEKKLQKEYPDSRYVAALTEEEDAWEKEKEEIERRKREAAAEAKRRREEAKRREETEPTTERAVVQPDAEPGSWEEKGDQYNKEGLAIYRKAMPVIGTSKFDAYNKKALDAFTKAVDAYEKAIRQGGGASVEQKMVKANSLRYGCFKMSRVH